MSIQPVSFDFLHGLGQWGLALLTLVIVGLFVAVVTSLALDGLRGPGKVLLGAFSGIREFVTISPRRVFAVARLTWKESIRRKALLVFLVFGVLFMFGTWFMPQATQRVDMEVQNYVAFVFFAMNGLVLPVVLLLSCLGLPEDIRLRSLHTVVTKPIHRNEVVLGRMLGFAGVGTMVLAVMSVVGYVWVVRQVSNRAELICRVPVYGELGFLDRMGNPGAGLNVGDIVQTRGFIEGGSKMAGVWRFPLPFESDEFKFESRFEAFRTWKGDMTRTLRVRFLLVNAEKKLRVPLPPVLVNEFAQNVISVPRKVKWTDEETLQEREADLYSDLAQPVHETDTGIAGNARKGVLEVHVQCLDRGQFIGASAGDFFIRMADRSFAVGYFKAVVGVWLRILICVMVAVTGSCFVKWPVATLLTASILLIGQSSGIRAILVGVINGTQRGGGASESVYRLITHMNDTSPMPEGALTVAIKGFDLCLNRALWLIQYIIPDQTTFSMQEWVAKGFDVPWDGILLPSIAIVAGYFIPCLLLGYFSLSLRELEAK